MEKANLKAKLHILCEDRMKGLKLEEQLAIVIDLEDRLEDLVKKAREKKVAKEPIMLRRSE